MNEPVTDLAVLDAEATVTTLSIYRDPEVVLEEARKAARALKAVIDGKKKKVEFNGETYLEFEDWQTVGRFYGVTPRITVTNYVEYGDIKGWEAHADAVHVASGRVVSSADAMCLNDEEKWRDRPKYEHHYVLKSGGTSAEDPGPNELVWIENPNKPGSKMPKRERVLVGKEAVPMFQLRSMAQTRAGAKAMRQALAWVVVLAGYRPTPAEELPTDTNSPAGDTGSQEPAKPAVRADGAGIVTSVETKTGQKANGQAWTRYLVTFADGRSASTFDKKLAEKAEQAKADGEYVIPVLEQAGQFTNLTGLKSAGAPEQAPAEGGNGGGNGEAYIADAFRKRITATMNAQKWTAGDMMAFLQHHGALDPQGQPSSAHIKRKDFDRLLEMVKKNQRAPAMDGQAADGPEAQ